MAQAQYAIIGAGAIGSIVGAHLARAGHSVLMLARGARADHLQRYGLQISGLNHFNVEVPVLTDPSQLQSAEVLMLATKTYSNTAALAAVARARIGIAFSIQNGIMKDEQLSEQFGQDHVLGALADTSGELLAGGEVLFTRNEDMTVGELGGGDSARAQQLAAALSDAGIRSTAVGDIVSREWSKFAAWTGMASLAAITRAPSYKYLSDEDGALVLVRLVREIGVLASASGVELSDHSTLPVATVCRVSESEAVRVLRERGEDMRLHAPQHRMSTLQDLEAGRTLEIDETLGWAVRKASSLNVPVPLLDSVYRLVAAIGRTRSSAR